MRLSIVACNSRHCRHNDAHHYVNDVDESLKTQKRQQQKPHNTSYPIDIVPTAECIFRICIIIYFFCFLWFFLEAGLSKMIYETERSLTAQNNIL